MYHILQAEADGDLYANTRYDQTTPFYNLVMDALETAQEINYSTVPVVQLTGGEYDFYSGYADWSNGSAIPQSVPISGAEYIEIRGVKKEETGDETVLRLHGDLQKMQWMFFRLCRNVKFSDLRIEYADTDIYCPISNPHQPPIYEMGVPDRLDSYTVVFTECEQIYFERVKLYGENITWVFSKCQGVSLHDISGSGRIYLMDCFGIADLKNINCYLEIRQEESDDEVLLMPQMETVENAVICDHFDMPKGGDVYVRPKKAVFVKDFFTGEMIEIKPE